MPDVPLNSKSGICEKEYQQERQDWQGINGRVPYYDQPGRICFMARTYHRLDGSGYFGDYFHSGQLPCLYAVRHKYINQEAHSFLIIYR